MVTSLTDAARLGLGSVQWGQRYGIANTAGQPSLDELTAIIAVAGEAGVRTIDTARDYGESEERIGNAAAVDGWRIVTKLTAQLPSGSAGEAERAARASIASSMAALHRTSLDTLLVHRLEHTTAWGGVVWRTLVEYRDAGRVRALGVSALGAAEAWAALEHPDVEVIQVAGSLLDQRLFRSGFFDAAIAAGKEVFLRSVFLQGVAHMSPEQIPEKLLALRPGLRQIRGWSGERGWPAFASFLYFAHMMPGVRVLIGAETVDQMRQCLAEWARAPERSRDLSGLAAAIAPVPDAVLNPWQW